MTEATYAIAARLGLASPSVTTPDPIGTLTPVPVPASGNYGGGAVSAFVREYQPSGYDGHFVAYQNPDAVTDVATFLAAALHRSASTVDAGAAGDAGTDGGPTAPPVGH